MSDLEYYAWITFFVVGLVSLPLLFKKRKRILQRIRILINAEKAKQHQADRNAFHTKDKIDPWKDNLYR